MPGEASEFVHILEKLALRIGTTADRGIWWVARHTSACGVFETDLLAVAQRILAITDEFVGILLFRITVLPIVTAETVCDTLTKSQYQNGILVS